MRSALVVLGAVLCAAPLSAADGSISVVDDVVIGEPPTSLTPPVHAQFLVRLDGAVAFPVTVGWTTQDLAGMATSTADYVAASGTLTFTSNGTQAIQVQIQHDGLWEGAETFFVTLSTTSGVAIVDGQAHGVITDQGSSKARCDLNGDGRSDVLIRTRVEHKPPSEQHLHNNRHDPYALRGTVVQEVSGYQSAGGAMWESPNTNHWEAVAAHDFSGSGSRCDVLWKWSCADGAHDYHGRFALTRGGADTSNIRPPEGEEVLPDGSLPPDWQLTSEWELVGSGRFDSNPGADLLWWNSTSGTLRVWRSTAVGFASGGPDLAGRAPSWQAIGVLDVDGDGDADILWRHKDTGALEYGLMQAWQHAGGGSLAPGSLADPCWQLVATGDFNGDGHDDLHWQNQNSQKSVVWFMDGPQRRAGSYLSPDHLGIANPSLLTCPATCVRDCSSVAEPWYIEGPR